MPQHRCVPAPAEVNVRRVTWVGAIGLANTAAAGIAATWVMRDATGQGWTVIVPSAILATLGLSLGLLWWATRRPPRLRTGVGLGLLIGVLVHPVTWYLALLLAFVSGTRTSLDEPT